MLVRDDIVAVCPPPAVGKASRVVWDNYVQALTSPEGKRLLISGDINTPLRLIHLLATMAVETGLTVLWESDAYSAEGISNTFGFNKKLGIWKHSARVSDAEARAIAALPLGKRGEVLFERVYGAGNPKKAKELGNTQPGDGHRFRGLGLPQLTGRGAHEAMAKKLGCRLEELCLPINCLAMLIVEWTEKNCNHYADLDDEISIRKLINSGSLKTDVSKINGLPEVRAAVKRAKKVITLDDFKDYEVIADTAADPPTKTDNKPDSMANSTEAPLAISVQGGGLWKLWLAIKLALKGEAATGALTFGGVATSLLGNDDFWIGAGFVFAGVIWYAKRRYRLYVDGV